MDIPCGIGQKFKSSPARTFWCLGWPNGSLVQQLGIHRSQQTIEGHNEAGVNIYAKNLTEQFLRLLEEESDLVGPYLDPMRPFAVGPLRTRLTSEINYLTRRPPRATAPNQLEVGMRASWNEFCGRGGIGRRACLRCMYP